jgi:UPF0755 protein
LIRRRFLIFEPSFSIMAEVPKIKLAIFLIGSMLLISFSFYAYQIVYVPNVLVDVDDRLIEIKSGTSYRGILVELDKQGVVHDMVSFGFLARLKGFDKKIQPGRYMLRRNMTNLAAINAMMSGRNEAVNVTFTNVRLLTELNEKITKNIGVTTEEFDDALNGFIRNNQEGFTKENILAMFIPNTYQVYYNVIPEDLINRFHEEYLKFWSDERKAKAKEVGLTPIEVSILASIVQAEVVKQDEAPTIAGLYINRLKKDIALQADPTLVYALGDFTVKRVLNQHKEIESPYNTYKYTGLPPGPINMPQIANIDAVLNYEKSNYIYMCAREDFSGYHNFTSSLTQHNQNAARYQHALVLEIRKGRANAKAKKK